MRQTFRHWHAEQESLESQLAESLAALSAYQSHLDAWQQQLARDREELGKAREQWERDRAVGDCSAELEQLRGREKQLTDALEEQKRTLETERAKWAQELDQLRKDGGKAQPAPASGAASGPPTPKPMDESPVLGSIMEQFGKLRQQRASDRQALKKTTR